MTDHSEPMRSGRVSERGQIIPMLALTIVTMGVMAMVAITFGQALARRQQAQMVVDAAAFAGASEQAKALNTIARINEKELAIFNGIVISQAESVYFDNNDTTWSRINYYGIYNDWAEENWESFQPNVFDRLNTAIDRVNYTYRVFGAPKHAAEGVVAANFGYGSDHIFHDENAPATTGELSILSDQGPVVWLSDEVAARSRLVELTEPKEYDAGGERWYWPYPLHDSVTCDPDYGVNVYCDYIKGTMLANYFLAPYSATIHFEAKALGGSHPTYRLGKFYANTDSDDVRFTYFLRLPAVSPVVAKGFFKDLPAIEVVAAAKPYAGHLGADFSHWTTPFYVGKLEQQGQKEISASYNAKLIPVHGTEKNMLALLAADPRYFSIMH